MSALARTPEARAALAQFQATKEAERKRNKRDFSDRVGILLVKFLFIYFCVGVYGYAGVLVSHLLGLVWMPLRTITVVLLVALPILWTGRTIGRYRRRWQLNRRVARYWADQIIFEVPSEVFKAWWRAFEVSGVDTRNPLVAPAEHPEVIYRLTRLRQEIDQLKRDTPDNESEAERAERQALEQLAKDGMSRILTEAATVLAEQIAYAQHQVAETAQLQRAADQDLRADRVHGLLAE